MVRARLIFLRTNWYFNSLISNNTFSTMGYPEARYSVHEILAQSCMRNEQKIRIGVRESSNVKLPRTWLDWLSFLLNFTSKLSREKSCDNFVVKQSTLMVKDASNLLPSKPTSLTCKDIRKWIWTRPKINHHQFDHALYKVFRYYPFQLEFSWHADDWQIWKRMRKHGRCFSKANWVFHFFGTILFKVINL